MATTHTIDAKGKTIGRIATEAASVLMAKNSASFKRNAVASVTVTILNSSAIVIDQKKLLNKTYHSHSGYPGSDKQRPLKEIIAKKGHGEAIRRAVKGMLPLNTLRDKRMKNLVIEK